MPDPKLYVEVLNNGSQDLYIRDAEAQEEIAQIKETIKNGASYIGKFVSAVVNGETVTTLKDGDAVTSITTTKGTFVPGTPASGQNKLNEGDYVEIQGTGGKPSVEFMWNGTGMDEFGSTSLLKSLAFKDRASGSYTPAGTNASSAVTFTGQTDGDFVTGFDVSPVLPSYQEGAFDAGELPSMTYDASTRKLTFGAGALPSKAADTFNAGTAPTLATDKAVTAVGTGEAAAQVFSGTAATITVE